MNSWRKLSWSQIFDRVHTYTNNLYIQRDAGGSSNDFHYFAPLACLPHHPCATLRQILILVSSVAPEHNLVLPLLCILTWCEGKSESATDIDVVVKTGAVTAARLFTTTFVHTHISSLAEENLCPYLRCDTPTLAVDHNVRTLMPGSSQSLSLVAVLICFTELKVRSQLGFGLCRSPRVSLERRSATTSHRRRFYHAFTRKPIATFVIGAPSSIYPSDKVN